MLGNEIQELMVCKTSDKGALSIGNDHSGQTLDDKYDLISPIGTGGMAAVYLGIHKGTGRKVAVKILHSVLLTNQELVQRFEQEARAAVAIDHKNIIEVLDLGTTHWGCPYMVLEYLKGESLEAFISSKGRLSLQTVCRLMRPVLSVLDAAHKQGYIHRDLKPSNIFICPDEDGIVVKLIDLGISKCPKTEGFSDHTRAGSFWGSPDYASPEQTRCSDDIDHRSDLFSVGVMVYQMLTGALPFEGSLMAEKQMAILNKPYRPPREVNGDFPPQMDTFMERALAKEPRERFSSALEMRDYLEEVEDCTKITIRQKNDFLAKTQPGKYLDINDETGTVVFNKTSEINRETPRKGIMIIVVGALFFTMACAGFLFYYLILISKTPQTERVVEKIFYREVSAKQKEKIPVPVEKPPQTKIPAPDNNEYIATAKKKIFSHRSELSSCYLARNAKVPKLAGSVAMNITVETNGRIKKINVTRDTLNDPVTVRCLKRRMRAYVFAPHEMGEITVPKSFVFVPPKPKKLDKNPF